MAKSVNIIEAIKESWDWSGIQPDEVISDNAFGNLIVKDIRGIYWRICPEDAYCKVVASSLEELKALSSDDDFLEDWNMEALLELAKGALGDLANGDKYCLIIPGILGGEYRINNIKTVSLVEIIKVYGDIGKQIKDLPDGSKIRLEVTD